MAGRKISDFDIGRERELFMKITRWHSRYPLPKYSWIPGRTLPLCERKLWAASINPGEQSFAFRAYFKWSSSRFSIEFLWEEGRGGRGGKEEDEEKRERNRGKFGVNIYQTFIDWARRKRKGGKTISPAGESSLLCYSWKRMAVRKWRISGCSQGHAIRICRKINSRIGDFLSATSNLILFSKRR